jgi:hypothetical protein
MVAIGEPYWLNMLNATYFVSVSSCGSIPCRHVLVHLFFWGIHTPSVFKLLVALTFCALTIRLIQNINSNMQNYKSNFNFL